MATVILKIPLHCEGCIVKIRRCIFKIKGVNDVVVDATTDLVMVTGTMHAYKMPGYLKEKLCRPVEVVEVVAPNKKSGDGGKDGVEKDDVKKGKGKHQRGYPPQTFSDRNTNACCVM